MSGRLFGTVVSRTEAIRRASGCPLSRHLRAPNRIGCERGRGCGGVLESSRILEADVGEDGSVTGLKG
jgi:hypothetical protein